jgi:hypothetical protein
MSDSFVNGVIKIQYWPYVNKPKNRNKVTHEIRTFGFRRITKINCGNERPRKVSAR